MTQDEIAEVFKWALTSGLIIGFMEANAGHPEFDGTYYKHVFNTLNNQIPNVVKDMLVEWVETDEGIDWRIKMGLPPFDAFSRKIDDEDG